MARFAFHPAWFTITTLLVTSGEATFCGPSEPTKPNDVRFSLILPNATRSEYSKYRVLPSVMQARITVEKMGVLPQRNIVFNYCDSNCSAIQAPLAAVDSFMTQGTHAFLGPVCEYAVAPVARYSYYWGIPLLTSGAKVYHFGNKREYRLLTRVSDSYVKLGLGLAYMMRHFRFLHLGQLYEDFAKSDELGRSDHFFETEGIYMSVKTALRKAPWFKKFSVRPDGFIVPSTMKMLKQVFKKTRGKLITLDRVTC